MREISRGKLTAPAGAFFDVSGNRTAGDFFDVGGNRTVREFFDGSGNRAVGDFLTEGDLVLSSKTMLPGTFDSFDRF